MTPTPSPCLRAALARRVATWACVPLALMAIGSATVAMAADETPGYHDYFYFLGEMNKASTVVVIENGIVPPDLGKKIASAVDRVIKNGDQPGAKRPSDDLQYEPLIPAITGPDGSRVHSGRSRQDIFERTQFPLTQEQYQNSLTAQNMLASSKGLGGPQRAEVVRMPGVEKAKLAKDAAWLQQQRQKLAQAFANLDRIFYALGQ